MKFEQLIPLFLNKPNDQCFSDFEKYVHIRNQDINTFNEQTKKKIARQSKQKDAIIFTEEEKALMKALGLKPKDLAALRGIKSSKETLANEEEFDNGDDDEDVKELIDE